MAKRPFHRDPQGSDSTKPLPPAAPPAELPAETVPVPESIPDVDVTAAATAEPARQAETAEAEAAAPPAARHFSGNNPPAAGPAAPPRATRSASIGVPLSIELPAGYLPRDFHLDMQFDQATASTFVRVRHGLDAIGARLLNGRRVVSRADVVRWLFEQLTAAVAETPEGE